MSRRSPDCVLWHIPVRSAASRPPSAHPPRPARRPAVALYIHTYIYIYIYVYTCCCIIHTHTHTHTHARARAHTHTHVALRMACHLGSLLRRPPASARCASHLPVPQSIGARSRGRRARARRRPPCAGPAVRTRLPQRARVPHVLLHAVGAPRANARFTPVVRHAARACHGCTGRRATVHVSRDVQLACNRGTCSAQRARLHTLPLRCSGHGCIRCRCAAAHSGHGCIRCRCAARSRASRASPRTARPL